MSKARGADKIEPRPCGNADCGRMFKPLTFSGVYCSSACRKRGKRLRERERRQRKAAGKKPFVPDDVWVERMAQYIAEHPPLATRPSMSPIREFEAWL